MDENAVATQIVDAAYQIHSRLGPGLLESVYQSVLQYELIQRHLSAETEVPISLSYGELKFPVGFRADMIVNRLVIVELKSVDLLTDLHRKQLLTYLRLTGLHLGLLINFNVELIKYGIKRVANDLPEKTHHKR